MRTAKSLIRLSGCPGWSESSLGAQSLCWFCHVAAHRFYCMCSQETKPSVVSHYSRDMTKPTKWVCAQRRLRSAQSHQSLRCTWIAKDPSLLHADSEDSDQTGRCQGWSESSLGAHSFCWFCHVAAHLSQLLRLWHLSDRRPASAQSRQSLRCSHTWSMEVDKGSD